MKTQVKFEIETITSIANRDRLILARRIGEEEFWLNKSTKLDGIPVRSADIPRTVDKNGNQRLDLWGFILDDCDETKLTVGKIVHLESERNDMESTHSENEGGRQPLDSSPLLYAVIHFRPDTDKDGMLKLIGIFPSEERAESIIEEYRAYEGFRDYADSFFIFGGVPDIKYWEDGFFDY